MTLIITIDDFCFFNNTIRITSGGRKHHHRSATGDPVPPETPTATLPETPTLSTETFKCCFYEQLLENWNTELLDENL